MRKVELCRRRRYFGGEVYQNRDRFGNCFNNQKACLKGELSQEETIALRLAAHEGIIISKHVNSILD